MTITSSRPVKKANLNRLEKHTLTSSVNMNEYKNEYIIYVVVPGMLREDIRIYIENRELTISVARKEPLHCFLNYANRDEKFKLPVNADTMMIAANYRNGELRIHIPKGSSSDYTALTEIFVY